MNLGATGATIEQNQISGNTDVGVLVSPAGTAFHRKPDRHQCSRQRRCPNGMGVNVLSGETSFDGDTIAFNTGNGVTVGDDPLIDQVDFTDVSIHSNAGLGMDLGDDGVEDDPGDPDIGPTSGRTSRYSAGLRSTEPDHSHRRPQLDQLDQLSDRRLCQHDLRPVRQRRRGTEARELQRLDRSVWRCLLQRGCRRPPGRQGGDHCEPPRVRRLEESRVQRLRHRRSGRSPRPDAHHHPDEPHFRRRADWNDQPRADCDRRRPAG